MNEKEPLFQRKDGAIVSGLCNGIARYVDVDPNYVRIWWLGMSLFIGAKTLLIYAVLMFVVPYAKDETRSTALVDAGALKAVIVKRDARAFPQVLALIWSDLARRCGGGLAPRSQQG